MIVACLVVSLPGLKNASQNANATDDSSVSDRKGLSILELCISICFAIVSRRNSYRLVTQLSQLNAPRWSGTTSSEPDHRGVLTITQIIIFLHEESVSLQCTIFKQIYFLNSICKRGVNCPSGSFNQHSTHCSVNMSLTLPSDQFSFRDNPDPR